VVAVAGGAIVGAAAYDLSRAASGCSEANWLEVVVRSVLLVSSLQQALFLWWLHRADVRQ
jgi:hypothetical protein